MPPQLGFATLEEAVEFVSSLATASDWRLEVLRQRSGRLVFDVYDDQTCSSRRFKIRSDDGTFRVHRILFSTRTSLSWRPVLVGFLILIWLGINRQDEMIQDNPGETVAGRYGFAAAQLVRLILILTAIVALLFLIRTFRPSRRQANRLAKARLNELTTALTEESR